MPAAELSRNTRSVTRRIERLPAADTMPATTLGIGRPMKLTPVQTALLKRLQRYRDTPPTLGERLRLMAGFMAILLLLVLLLGYLTVRLRLPGGLLLVAGASVLARPVERAVA